MVDIGQRLLNFALSRAEQEARRQINRGFEEVFGRGSSRTVDSPGEQQLLRDANLFSSNGPGAIATIANRELQALGVSGSQRQQILTQLVRDPSIRGQAQDLQYKDPDTGRARSLIREIQDKAAALYGSTVANLNNPAAAPNNSALSRNTPPVAPGVFDRVQPQPPSLSAPQVPGNSSPYTQTLSDFLPRSDLFRFFSKLESYAGRNGEAGRTTDLRTGVRTAWSQVRGRTGDVSVQDLGTLVPEQLVEQARTSLSFRISRTLGAAQLSNIPDTILSAGNVQVPAGSPVAPATILQQIDRGAEQIARLAPSGGSAAGQTVKVLSVFYGLAAARLLATNGANEGTQARIERMLQASLAVTAQLNSPLASTAVTGADSSVAPITTSEPAVRVTPESVAMTPDVSSSSQDSVIPAQPVAVVPQSVPETTARTEPTSTQAREVSTGDSGAYQQLAQEIQQGNFTRARTYISPIAQRANVNPDELLEIMQTKVNGGREGSELLRAISVDQLAGSLAAIIHPGEAAAATEAVQVAALRAFRYGGAEGTLLSARENNRIETVAQALTAPDLPQPSPVVAAVPAFETNVVPAQPSTRERAEQEEEQDPTSRRRNSSTPNPTGLENLPDSVRRRVVQV